MVTEQVGQRPVRADGETRRAREIVFGDRRPLFLVVLTDPSTRLRVNSIRGHTTDNGFDLFSIRIVDKTRGGRTRDRNESILRVIREIEGLSPNVARDHVAVGIVRVRVSIRERSEGKSLRIGIVGFTQVLSRAICHDFF